MLLHDPLLPIEPECVSCLTVRVDAAGVRKLNSRPTVRVLGGKALLQPEQLPAGTAGLVAGRGLHQVSTAALAACREVSDLSPSELETWMGR